MRNILKLLENLVGSGGGGAVTYVQDTFTAADGTNLAGHVPDITVGGAAWVAVSGTHNITSNRARATSNTPQAVIETGQSNGVITVDVTTGQTTTTNTAQIIMRQTDADSMWFVHLNAQGDLFQLYEWDTGLTLRDSEVFAFDPNTTYALTITLNGTTITAQIGATILSYAPATFNLTATKHGLRSDHAGTVTNRTQYDNFLFKSA